MNTGSPNQYDLRFQPVSRELNSRYDISNPIKQDKLGELMIKTDKDLKEYIQIKNRSHDAANEDQEKTNTV